MLKKNVLPYFALGFSTAHLQFVNQEMPWEFIKEGIEEFIRRVNSLELPLTKKLIKPLFKFNDNIKNFPINYKISISEISYLKEIKDNIYNTLVAELSDKSMYHVSDKRIDVNKLLNNIASLMSPSVFDKIPEIAKYDFSEAGKCIAYECSTAAAFHILRGTEAILRLFYKKFTNKDSKNKNWGAIINDLEKPQYSSPNALVANLNNIRKNYRNPTQHPEKLYEIEETQDLFNLCIAIINQMSEYF